MKVIDENGNVKVTSAFDSGWTPEAVIFGSSAGRLTEDPAALSFNAATHILKVADLALGDIGLSGTDYFGAAHEDNANATDFALAQNGLGATILNAKTGQGITFSVNNTGVLSVNSTALFFGDGINISFATGTGTKIGTGTTQKLGFWNATPVARTSAFTQTYSVADKTHGARASTAVATTGATNVTPFGYTTAAQANDIVTQLNNVRLDMLDTAQFVNAVVDDLQTYGIFA